MVSRGFKFLEVSSFWRFQVSGGFKFLVSNGFKAENSNVNMQNFSDLLGDI